MTPAVLAILAAATGAAVLGATGAVMVLLRRHAIVDQPNPRGSHDRPVPRGGGLAVVPVLIGAWLTVCALTGEGAAIPVLAAGGLALAALSWRDDLRDLSPAVRLAGQGLAVAAALLWQPSAFAPAGSGPLVLIAVGLLWVWFVNLFNFMDGIDGIAATETTAIGAGVAAVAGLSALGGALTALGLTAAAAGLGFLWWNRPPARVFLGDVGSIPLGFLLGGLLLMLAAAGAWMAALILPLYYLADATLTLARRALRGEAVWQAHRQHAYQRAVDCGLGHGIVVAHIGCANAILVGLAVFSTPGYGAGGYALAAAVAVVALLLFRLSRRGTP